MDDDAAASPSPATMARWWRFVDAAVQVLLLVAAASMDDCRAAAAGA